MTQPAAKAIPLQAKVLTKAFLRMLDHYQLSRKECCLIVGFSEASLSRIMSQQRLIDPLAKEGEIVILLLRLYRSLNTLVGGNTQQAQQWLRSYNHYFMATPLEVMHRLSGLIEVVNYLDAMRGKI